MAAEKWLAPAALANGLTTELNGLADGSYSNAGVAIDNEAGLYRFINFDIALPSLTPTGTPFVALFALYSLDNGTTFADGGGAVAPRNTSLIAQFDFSTATGAKRAVAGGFPILPLQFKLVLLNKMGVSLAGTLNVVRYRLMNRQMI